MSHLDLLRRKFTPALPAKYEHDKYDYLETTDIKDIVLYNKAYSYFEDLIIDFYYY